MNTVKPFGRRILVEKERLDSGGMKLTPMQEEDGQKNCGKIIAIGSIGIMARLRGIKVGATVYFKKFFIANDGLENPLVFVDVEEVKAIKYE